MSDKRLVLYFLVAGVAVSLTPVPASACWLCWRHHYWRQSWYGTDQRELTVTSRTVGGSTRPSTTADLLSAKAELASVGTDVNKTSGGVAGTEENAFAGVIDIADAARALRRVAPDVLDLVGTFVVRDSQDKKRFDAIRRILSGSDHAVPAGGSALEELEKKLNGLEDRQAEILTKVEQIRAHLLGDAHPRNETDDVKAALEKHGNAIARHEDALREVLKKLTELQTAVDALGNHEG